MDDSGVCPFYLGPSRPCLWGDVVLRRAMKTRTAQVHIFESPYERQVWKITPPGRRTLLCSGGLATVEMPWMAWGHTFRLKSFGWGSAYGVSFLGNYRIFGSYVPITLDTGLHCLRMS